MSRITLSLFNAKDEIIKTSSNDYDAYFGISDAYEDGGYFQIEVDRAPSYVIVQIDSALAPALIYMRDRTWRYPIPKSRNVYHLGAFVAPNYAKARFANPEEIAMHQNLALNSHDQLNNFNAYPHASSKSDDESKLLTCAKNAIDGYLDNRGHGLFPFQAWETSDEQDQIKVDFGREVLLDGIGVILKADTDDYLRRATACFSDGSKQVLNFKPTDQKQQFAVTPIPTSFIVLTDLQGPVAITQLEAYGINILR